MLVTHDPKVAAYAHRVIRIVDGQVESDENDESKVVESVLADPAHDCGEPVEAACAVDLPARRIAVA